MKSNNLLLGFVITIFISCNSKNTVALDDSGIMKQDLNPVTVKEDTNEYLLGNSKHLDIKYIVQQLDNSNGLSNSSINTIFQDSENLIWIGTWDGLNRYDGIKFKIFRPELNNENSLSNQVILKIVEDDIGHLWILTMYGVNRYDKKTNTFQRYYFSRKNSPTSSESEFNIALDNSGKVFCAVKDWGIGYFDGNEFKHLEINGLPTKSVKKMEFSPTGELLLVFDDDKLFSLKIETTNVGGKIISKYKMISDNVNSFKTLSNQKICILSIQGDAKIYSLSKQKYEFIQKKDIQNIIGYTSEGCVLSDKLSYFMIDNLGSSVNKSWLKYLDGQDVKTLIEGTENIIWVGTDGEGVFKIYPRNKSFNVVNKVQVPELNRGIVRVFLEIENNSFWFGTKGKGLFRYPSKFYLNSKESLAYENFNESNSTLNNAVYALCKGQDNLMFIGTDGDGISVFDLQNSKLISWSEILGSEQLKKFKSIYTIFQDKKGLIWIGGTNSGINSFGLIRFKIERIGEKLRVSQFKTYPTAEAKDGSISSNIIYSIVPKNKDELWIGTRLGGLNLFDKKTGLFKVYKNEKDNPQSLSNNDILCLHIDAKKRLWIGTSFGLNLLEDLKNDGEAVFKSFTVKDGLPNNTIHGIASDNNSNLWLSTNFGLSNFKIDESKFINFTKNDGLQNNEFADGAYYQDASTGFVFMGGIKGFNYFLPSKIVESAYIPNILIDEISGQANEKAYYQGLVISPNSKSYPSIVLDHNQNFFDIELSALTYINSEKCQYAYQLKNFDKDWNTINNRRNISYTNVPQGNYSLWIKWSNSDGIWTDPVRAIDIKIKPVFWKSNIAIVIYIILFILLMLLVVSYYRKQQLLKQNILFRKKDEEIHQNRLTFFTNIAHEFQTPLTLIIGPIQKLSEVKTFNEKNQKFIRMIQRNSSRLLFLTQQLLEFRKAEYDHLEVEVKEFDLVNLVEQIAELFDEWALKKNIDYSISLPTKLIGWFDKDKIEKIIFNLLSNAFKYTSKEGKIMMHLLFEERDVKKLIIKVSNTGKGVSKEKLNSLFDRFFLSDNSKNTDQDTFRTGIGLAYIKKLITVLKGEINVTSKVNKITVFTVSLPCSKDVFNEKYFDKEVRPILISHHLKNILEDVSSNTIDIPNKISALELIINRRKVVLIVDDEKEIQLFLNELLREEYKVVTANNGIEALKIVNKEIPDIIISDVMMPLMDGIELCKKIKTDLKTCHIPFIMLTAKSSITHRIEGLESGANSYIPKPFYPEHILIRVKKLIEEQELILKHLTQDAFFENLTSLPIKEEEKEFIKKIVKLIRENIDNENLQSLFIEKNLGISSSKLYRKIKQIFSLSPGDLIRTIRLKHAAELLQKGILTVSEVCYQSGFNNRSYFYREFNKMYNLTPKNYQLKYNSGQES